MFNIKKEIKKRICYGFSTYEDGKFGVPYINLVMAILLFIGGIMLAGVVLVLVFRLLLELILSPYEFLTAIISLLYDQKFQRTGGIVIGLIVVSVSLIKLRILNFLFKKHILSCDLFQPSPEVIQIYNNILSLDTEKKRQFTRLLLPIDNQLSKDIRKAKE